MRAFLKNTSHRFLSYINFLLLAMTIMLGALFDRANMRMHRNKQKRRISEFSEYHAVIYK